MKMTNDKWPMLNGPKGFSLVEILVVITIFGIVGVLATQGLFLTFRGTRKSDSVRQVREELNYATAVMERLLHNALSGPGRVDCPVSYAGLRVEYTDLQNQSASFSCEDIAGVGYVASRSARLTSENIMITDCNFTCNTDVSGSVTSVDIQLTGQVDEVSGFGSNETEVNTKIYLPQTY